MKFQYKCKYLVKSAFCIQNTLCPVFFSDNYNNFAVIKQLVLCYENYHILLCPYVIHYDSSTVFHDVAMRFFTPAQRHISAALALVIKAICCYNERYDNMRRCRNVAFIEADCDELACYNKHFDRIQLRCMVVFIETCCDELACYNNSIDFNGVAVR